LGRESGARGRQSSASSALLANVIDLVARNPGELLQLIDGRTVELAVATSGSWRQRA